MKINKNLNWKTFFLRLTILLSIPSFIIGYIIGNNMLGKFSFAIFMGVFTVILLWDVYIAIRWLYRGLYKNEDTD